MKRLILGILLAFSTCFHLYSIDPPAWVKGAPYNPMNYNGIGSASKSDNNYQEIATRHALSQLAAQIKITISTESILKTVETQDVTTTDFMESINMQVAENIEGYHLVESWQDENEYWVYYELNRFDYEEWAKARREKVCSTALEYWIKGNNALAEGNINSATTFYAKGLDSLSAFMHENLKCTYQGKVINIASELYSSLITLWSDVILIANPSTVEVELLKGASEGIAIGCYKRNIALSGVSLTAKFEAGEGIISPLSPTNSNGVSALYITSITSKLPSQQVSVKVVAGNFSSYSTVCQTILRSLKLPVINIPLTLNAARLTACVESDNMEIEVLSNSLSSLISNGYFDTSSDPNNSDLIIKLESTFTVGREVNGELYNTREYAGSLTMNILDNRTQKSVGQYTVDRATSLLPLDRSTEQAKQAVSREILKRANRELPHILSQIRIDTSSSIPVRVKPSDNVTPTPTPVPTLPPSVDVPQPVTPTPKQEIKGLLEKDIWVTYKGITHINNNTIIELVIDNCRDTEYVFDKFLGSQIKVYNQKGEVVNVTKVEIGGVSNSYRIISTIVSGIPTKMLITINKLESISLLQIGDMKMRSLK